MSFNLAIRFLGLVVLLNVARYAIGGPIEAYTIMEPMHRVLPLYPEVFDNDFTSRDFAISLGYNFMLWFAAALGFHLMQPNLSGGWVLKSFKGYGVMCLSFVSLTVEFAHIPHNSRCITGGGVDHLHVSLYSIWILQMLRAREKQFTKTKDRCQRVIKIMGDSACHLS